MADIFSSHQVTGAAKGPTRDPATFSRDLNVSVECHHASDVVSAQLPR